MAERIPYLNLDYLNKKHGNAGKTFHTEEFARKYAAEHRGARVYRLWNHKEDQAITDENKICIGWLVCKTAGKA